MWRLPILVLMALVLMASGCNSGDDDDDNGISDDPLASVPFNALPDWESDDRTSRSTGLGVADINGDGLTDIVVANGNDMQKQALVVYYNQGGGVFNPVPDWQSDDTDYHGHLSIADVNHDGRDDVAVSVYLGQQGFSSPGHVKVYLNRDGELEPLPSWRSANDFFTFSCRFGDLDGDGYPDLAVATGESYTQKASKNKVYLNRSGTLDTTPVWESGEYDFAYDVVWGDIDGDGDLDLLFVRSMAPAILFTNRNGILDDYPSWQALDESIDTNSLVLGDVNRDGWLDLAVSDNYQLGGEGKFKLYMNIGGELDDQPIWTSIDSGFGSGIYFQDIDRDGYPELITGSWGENNNIGSGRVRLYDNQQGIFSAASSWVSESRSVVEAITTADLAGDALRTDTETFSALWGQSTFQVQRAPFEKVDKVTVNDQILDARQWCFDRETGWISINRSDVKQGDTVMITISSTKRPDLIVSNWDRTRGNYIFFNTAD